MMFLEFLPLSFEAKIEEKVFTNVSSVRKKTGNSGNPLQVTHFHPMWPPTDPAVQCPKYWWQNVLFINSLFNNRCMPWTWYIGTEFIYFLISPIFLLLLRQSPQLGLGVSVAVIAMSAGANTVKIINSNFPPTQFLWRQPEMFNLNFIQVVILILPGNNSPFSITLSCISHPSTVSVPTLSAFS